MCATLCTYCCVLSCFLFSQCVFAICADGIVSCCYVMICFRIPCSILLCVYPQVFAGILFAMFTQTVPFLFCSCLSVVLQLYWMIVLHRAWQQRKQSYPIQVTSFQSVHKSTFPSKKLLLAVTEHGGNYPGHYLFKACISIFSFPRSFWNANTTSVVSGLVMSVRQPVCTCFSCSKFESAK